MTVRTVIRLCHDLLRRSKRSDAGEETRAGTAFGENGKWIFEYCAHIFKKGDGGDGSDGLSEICRNCHRPSPRHLEKHKTRFMITAPAFQKNAFMNIAPTISKIRFLDL